MWGDPIWILKESNAIRTDGRLPTGLASLAASLAGVGGVVCIFNFSILLILLIFLIIRAMFWGSLWVAFSLTFAVIYNENHEIIKNFSMIFFQPGDLKNIGNHCKWLQNQCFLNCSQSRVSLILLLFTMVSNVFQVAWLEENHCKIFNYFMIFIINNNKGQWKHNPKASPKHCTKN